MGHSDPQSWYEDQLPSPRLVRLQDYVSRGLMSEAQHRMVQRAILDRKNILIVGLFGGGRTTFLQAVLNEVFFASPLDKLMLLELRDELRTALDDVMYFHTRTPLEVGDWLRAARWLVTARIVVDDLPWCELNDLFRAWQSSRQGGFAVAHAVGCKSALAWCEEMVAHEWSGEVPAVVAGAVSMVVALNEDNELRDRFYVEEVRDIGGHDGLNYVYESEVSK